MKGLGDTVFVLQLFHPTTGEEEGYLTDRGTFCREVTRAVGYQMRELAQARCNYLSTAVGYRFYVWVVEEVADPHQIIARVDHYRQ